MPRCDATVPAAGALESNPPVAGTWLFTQRGARPCVRTGGIVSRVAGLRGLSILAPFLGVLARAGGAAAAVLVDLSVPVSGHTR